MIKAILILALISSAFALDKAMYKQWKSHVAKYNRKFQSAEESRASYQNFARAAVQVEEHNRRFAAGQETYEQELNKFSDLDAKEAIKQHTGLLPDETIEQIGKQHSISKRATGATYLNSRKIQWSIIVADANLPASVDHTQHLVAIKDQGQCGSCYAHATATAIEMNVKKQFGVSIPISVQQIVDCSHNSTGFGNLGCNGGTITNSLDYTVACTNSSKGILTEAQDPYKLYAGQYTPATNCATTKSLSTYGYKVTTYHMSNREDVQAMKTLLRDTIAFCHVYVDQAFMSYKTGIFQNTACTIASGCRPNHAVVFAGYGTESGQEYFWLINSWGTGWGISGKMKVGVKSALAHYLCASPIMAKL